MPNYIKKPAINVQIVNQNSFALNQVSIKSFVKKVWFALGEEGVITGDNNKQNLTIAFLNVQDMQKLSRKFRNKNKPTDILSFAEPKNGPSTPTPLALGELALCPAMLSKSRPKHLSKTQWMYYLILHGLLHLLGFEHGADKTSAKKMYHLQDKIFYQLQLKNPLT